MHIHFWKGLLLFNLQLYVLFEFSNHMIDISFLDKKNKRVIQVRELWTFQIFIFIVFV